MKNMFRKMLVILAIIVGLMACQSKKDGAIKGLVEEIQNGKDGYTAIIKTEENEKYYVTISHANLKDPNQYQTTKLGETIEVIGDQWEMEGEKHITVREVFFK